MPDEPIIFCDLLADGTFTSWRGARDAGRRVSFDKRAPAIRTIVWDREADLTYTEKPRD